LLSRRRVLVLGCTRADSASSPRFGHGRNEADQVGCTPEARGQRADAESPGKTLECDPRCALSL